MTLYAEALATFDSLFAQAKAAGIPEPTAMSVATATPDGADGAAEGV
jgi:pyridoxamine 5'-phosphate oxidase